MSTANTVPIKTATAVSVLGWTDITAGAINIGTPIDIATKRAMRLFIRMARKSGSVFTLPPILYVQACDVLAGVPPKSMNWIDIYNYPMSIGVNLANTTLNGAVAAGDTTFVVNTATNLGAGDFIFLAGNTAATNEIVRFKGIASSTVTLWEGVSNAHASGNTVIDQAEIVAPRFNVEDFAAFRIVIDNSGSARDISVNVTMTSYDSDTITY